MSSDRAIDALSVAEHLWKQGDHDGAWLAIEELPPMPEVIDLRLRGGLDRISAWAVKPIEG